jgi:UDP-N-acetylmuramyl pentapeptide phosphotransferase/UDP-N-acetylglucosamine-1-phosphate transferase
MVVAFPSIVVVLFYLLRLRLQTPTAGGLSFLTAILIAYWLFPKSRVSYARFAAGVFLAVAVALGMGLLFAHGS